MGWVSKVCLLSGRSGIHGCWDGREAAPAPWTRARWLAIEAFVENRADGTVGSGADLEATAAGGFEPFCAVLASQAQNAEAGAEALLGMGPAAQDDLDQGGGVGSDDVASRWMRSCVQPA